jgi:hypothetical protein
MKRMRFWLLILLFSAILSSSPLRAQTITTQERFHDLFITAGYGTAFGAATGAALLSFQNQPDQNLRYVAIGASLGFIGGSLLGSYVVFSPVFQADMPQSQPTLLANPTRSSLIVRPSVDPVAGKINHLEGIWTMMKF